MLHLTHLHAIEFHAKIAATVHRFDIRDLFKRNPLYYIYYIRDGWTTILSRGQHGNAVDYFDKTWTDYECKFGDPKKEFWIGLKNLYEITQMRNYELRVQLKGVDEVHAEAYYDSFKITSNLTYDLQVSGYKAHMSTASDILGINDGAKFATSDNDPDSTGCPGTHQGPWWFSSSGTCTQAHLLGPNHNTNTSGTPNIGILWPVSRLLHYSRLRS